MCNSRYDGIITCNSSLFGDRRGVPLRQHGKQKTNDKLLKGGRLMACHNFTQKDVAPGRAFLGRT